MTIVDVPPPASQEQRDRFLKLLGQFSTAMLVTHAGEDRLRARPMAIAQVKGDEGRIWFVTAHETAKAHEIETDTRVHIICQKDHSAYLSLAGRANVVSNPAKVEELWQESFKVWFPKGETDPTIALIAVDLEEAEYWDNEGWNKIRYLLDSAAAYMSGTTPPGDDKKQHAFVRLP